jgi:hypothetical protein
MDKTSQGVGSDEPQKPQYQQNRSNSEKHDYSPFMLLVAKSWRAFAAP